MRGGDRHGGDRADQPEERAAVWSASMAPKPSEREISHPARTGDPFLAIVAGAADRVRSSHAIQRSNELATSTTCCLATSRRRTHTLASTWRASSKPVRADRSLGRYGRLRGEPLEAVVGRVVRVWADIGSASRAPVAAVHLMLESGAFGAQQRHRRDQGERCHRRGATASAAPGPSRRHFPRCATLPPGGGSPVIRSPVPPGDRGSVARA